MRNRFMRTASFATLIIVAAVAFVVLSRPQSNHKEQMPASKQQIGAAGTGIELSPFTDNSTNAELRQLEPSLPQADRSTSRSDDSDDRSFEATGSYNKRSDEMDSKELELNWMVKHGIPADLSLQEFAQLSEDEIRERALKGDLVARVALGELLARNPIEHEVGVNLLLQAAADGSIFALHTLANVLGPEFSWGSREARYAHWQAAAAMGDTRIVPFLALESENMTKEEFALAQFQFVQLMTILGEMSLNRNGYGLRPSMRPLGPEGGE